MHNFKKAIINLDGHSNKIKDTSILKNIKYALSSLHIPFEIYKAHKSGFTKLQEDMNQDDTLYVLNDSLQFHLCEKPHILISRIPHWVQATPKTSTIGILTNEMISSEPSQIISLIARNQSVRQHYDLLAATNYILASDYTTKSTDAFGRNGLAAFSWRRLIFDDLHTQVLLHTDNKIPLVNEILKEGIESFSHPDDILIFINRDICLVPEATGIIRTYMDSHNIDACYAKRVDVDATGLLNFNDIQNQKTYEGFDLFAFRPNAKCLSKLLEVDLYIGRMGWDSFWSHEIKNEIPYKICYHLKHDSDWIKNHDCNENIFNMIQINKHNNNLPYRIEGTGVIVESPL